jgi:transposase
LAGSTTGTNGELLDGDVEVQAGYAQAKDGVLIIPVGYEHEMWTQQSLSYAQTTEALTQWKKEPETAFLKDVSCVLLQQSLRNLDAAFNNLFEKNEPNSRLISFHCPQTLM